ncbi:hypothetical protein BaRGS_00002325 [Batillaria attramentaria]|uniref:Secreted protein n=1 Tax=Batillaria attramentaria TaxID=370345 RepID=A0ABD0M3F2_9CAEN
MKTTAILAVALLYMATLACCNEAGAEEFYIVSPKLVARQSGNFFPPNGGVFPPNGGVFPPNGGLFPSDGNKPCWHNGRADSGLCSDFQQCSCQTSHASYNGGGSTFYCC